MQPLRVLIVARSLRIRGGVQLYVRDLALGLRRRGHQPVVFSTELGGAADELGNLTVPVTSDLASFGARPDIIHGNHSLETMTALHAFPSVPAIFVSHGWGPWYAAAPNFPRIRRYVAVDDTCLDRMLFRDAVPEERAAVVLNAVDLDRFRPRHPLSTPPRRALIFSNVANEMTHVGVIRDACRKAGLTVDTIGWSAGNPVTVPEAILGHYDIVFAKGKAALEAMAVGCAVILCDATGLGSMVTADAVPRLRRLNFGVRALDRPLKTEDIAAEVARFDPADAARVRDEIRRTAGLDDFVDRLIELYREAIADEQSDPSDRGAESLATGQYLQWLTVRIGEASQSEQLFPVLRLANRILRIPLLGRSIRSIASRLAVRG